MFTKPTPVKLTYEELLQFPDDGRRHELIDGDHYVTASPSMRHQRVLVRLLVGLELHLEEQGTGTVLPAPSDVVLSDADVVVPDLLVVLAANRKIVTESHVRGAPDLVVEILSPSTRSRDRELKRELYDSFGVREYWMVDPDEETVEVTRRESGRLSSVATLSADDSLSTPLLAGLELRLASVFEG